MSRRKLFALSLAAAAALGCASPNTGKTVDRLIDDCMREGLSEDACQQQRGCAPGMTREECRRTLSRSLGIWIKD